MNNGKGTHGRTRDPKRPTDEDEKSAPTSCARQPNARGGIGGASRAARLSRTSAQPIASAARPMTSNAKAVARPNDSDDDDEKKKV